VVTVCVPVLDIPSSNLGRAILTFFFLEIFPILYIIIGHAITVAVRSET
jgi:hypothetical protein